MTSEDPRDTSWIDDIVAAKGKSAEAAAAESAARQEDRRVLNAVVEDFFADVSEIIKASVDAYKSRAHVNVDCYAWPPDRYVIRKPTYPAGKLLIALDKDGELLKCSYEYTRLGEATSKEVLIFPVAVRDGRLYLRRSDGSEVLRVRIGIEILSRFFRKI